MSESGEYMERFHAAPRRVARKRPRAPQSASEPPRRHHPRSGDIPPSAGSGDHAGSGPQRPRGVGRIVSAGYSLSPEDAAAAVIRIREEVHLSSCFLPPGLVGAPSGHRSCSDVSGVHSRRIDPLIESAAGVLCPLITPWRYAVAAYLTAPGAPLRTAARVLALDYLDDILAPGLQGRQHADEKRRGGAHLRHRHARSGAQYARGPISAYSASRCCARSSTSICLVVRRQAQLRCPRSELVPPIRHVPSPRCWPPRPRMPSSSPAARLRTAHRSRDGRDGPRAHS